MVVGAWFVQACSAFMAPTRLQVPQRPAVRRVGAWRRVVLRRRRVLLAATALEGEEYDDDDTCSKKKKDSLEEKRIEELVGEEKRWQRAVRRVDEAQQRALGRTSGLHPLAQLAGVLAFFALQAVVLSRGCLVFPVQLIPNEQGLFQSVGYDSLAGAAVVCLRCVHLANRGVARDRNRRRQLLTAKRGSTLMLPAADKPPLPWDLPRPPPRRRALAGVVIMLLSAYLFSGFAGVALESLVDELAYAGLPLSIAMHRSLEVLCSHLVWVGSGALILTAFIPQFWKSSRWFRLKFREDWLPWVVGGFFASIFFFGCADSINQLLVPELLFDDDTIVTQMINPEDNDLVALAVGAVAPCLSAPWWEELLYRGFLLPAMAAHIPLSLALPISAFLFSAHHASLTAGLTLAVLGFVWAIIYIQSRNLLTTVVIHALWNSRVFVGAALGI